MSLLRSWLAGLPGYLWSGWGALASLFLLLAGWEAVASQYGALVLPTPLETFVRLLQLIDEGAAWPELLATVAGRCSALLFLSRSAACSGLPPVSP